MGNSCHCETEQATLTSPIASCSIGKCRFWGEIKVEQQPSNAAAIEELNVAIRAQVAAVEIEMRRQMLSYLEAFGALPPVEVNGGATSPTPRPRALSIRIKTIPGSLMLTQ